MTFIAAAALGVFFCSCKEINPPSPACTKCSAVTSFSDAAVNDSVHESLNVPDSCQICSVFIPRVASLTINTSANSLNDITKLTSLQTLIINNNTLSGFPQGITTLPIANLSFGATVLGDFSGVTTLPSLNTLQFTGCIIINPTSLYNASKLSRLVVSGCTLGIPTKDTALDWLNGMNWLLYVDVSNNGLQNINYAASLGAAATFIAAHNSIVSITALASMQSVKYVDLSYNSITDISPLVTNANTAGNGLSTGGYIDLRNNPLSPASIASIAGLQAKNITVLY